MRYQKISIDGLNVIKHYESLHDGNLKKIGLQPKMCPSGFWTIGYGHLVTDINGKPYEGKESYERMIKDHPEVETITELKAVELLDIDCDFREGIINRMNLNLSQCQFDSQVSLLYNIGAGQYSNSTVLRLLKTMNPTIYYTKAIEDAILAWKKSKGQVLPGLVARRKTEAYLFKTGEVKFFN